MARHSAIYGGEATWAARLDAVGGGRIGDVGSVLLGHEPKEGDDADQWARAISGTKRHSRDVRDRRRNADRALGLQLASLGDTRKPGERGGPSAGERGGPTTGVRGG